MSILSSIFGDANERYLNGVKLIDNKFSKYSEYPNDRFRFTIFVIIIILTIKILLEYSEYKLFINLIYKNAASA